MHLVRSALVAAVLCAIWPGGAARADVSTRRTVCITLSDQIAIAGSPVKVWAGLGHVRGLCTLLGIECEASPGRMDRIGATVRGRERFGASVDEGTLTTSFALTGRDMRTTWDPANGSYICHTRMEIVKSGEATVLRVTTRYTDDDVAHADATARSARDAFRVHLTAFKTLVESR